MILRNHIYLKVYKCWRILAILKTPTIKCLAIFFKRYFNFQGLYIIYIIIWRFLGWKNFTPTKLGERGHPKLQNGKSFVRENPLKIAHELNFTPKIILVSIHDTIEQHSPWCFLCIIIFVWWFSNVIYSIDHKPTHNYHCMR